MQGLQDHYEVLGIKEDATQAEIKAAWRQANSKAHPDREGGSHEAQTRVNEAYRVLGDPELRKAYDEGLEGFYGDEGFTKAREFLLQVFMAVIKQAPEGIDLVEDTRRMLMEHKNQHYAALNEHRQALGRVQRRANRLRFKGTSTDFLKAALDQHMSQLREAIEKCEEMVKRIDTAGEILDEYGFDMPQPKTNVGVWVEMDSGGAIPASHFAAKWPEGS